MNLSELQAAVIDIGSGVCKAGLAGEDAPAHVFPSVIGRHKQKAGGLVLDRKEYFIGHEAQRNRENLSMEYPVQRGIITNWDDMEKIWHHTFHDKMHITTSEHPVLMTEAPFNPKSNRELMTQIMFETFNVPAFYVSLQAILGLYASGRVDGIVFDSGDGLSHVIPKYEGYTTLRAIKRQDLAGRDITAYLQRMLNDRGNSFTTSSDAEIVRDIKEQHCYVATDFQSELKKDSCSSPIQESFLLPDGKSLSIGKERFQAPELLFQPSIFGNEEDGISKMIVDSIMQCDMDQRRDLYPNIILSGGNTMFPGIKERLHKEITSIVPPTMKVQIITYPERKYFVWIGGSIVASLSTFTHNFISKQEYNEHGPSIVHRKCVW